MVLLLLLACRGAVVPAEPLDVLQVPVELSDGRCTAQVEQLDDVLGHRATEVMVFEANGELVYADTRSGQPEQVRRQVWIERDVSGREVHKRSDWDGDGAMDFRSWFEYDQRGLSRWLYDRDDDGIAEWVTDYVRDSEGFELSAIDSTDGVAGLTKRTRWSTDHSVSDATRDNEGDGVIDSHWHTERADHGGLRLQQGDRDADGQLDWVERYEADAVGCPTTWSQDRDGDGLVDAVSDSICQDGQVLETVTHDFDDTVTWTREYAWDTDGLVWESLSWDSGGRIEVTYERDEYGNIVRMVRDGLWEASQDQVVFVVQTDCGQQVPQLWPYSITGSYLFGHPDQRWPAIVGTTTAP